MRLHRTDRNTTPSVASPPATILDREKSSDDGSAIASLPVNVDAGVVATLAVRERYRDEYWMNRDPISRDRLLWRAQTFRHTLHLLPGQTILELGCGAGMFTRPLLRNGVT